MTTSVTLVRLFDRSWAAWLRGVEACGKTPTRKAVHALRVDARRLEALIEVLRYATDAPPKALRRLAKVAGEPLDALARLRDDQVQRRLVGGMEGTESTEALLSYLHKRQTRHKKRALRALARIDRRRADAAARRVRKGVVRHQGAPTPRERTSLLLAAVDGAATDVRSRIARLDTGNSKTPHKLRIALKRFRYVTEIAEEVSPQVRVASQPTLRALQRRLGQLHDADVLLARLDCFAARARKHRGEVGTLKKTIESSRAGYVRGLSRSLPALRHALTELAARSSSRAVARQRTAR